MVFSAIRQASLKAPLAVALMLGCTILPAQAGWFGSDGKPAQKADSKPAAPATTQPNLSSANLPSTNLEDSIRQAQLLRLAGQYPEAVKHLSQLMMLASDDPRVISEYGKTLASMGRASDAVNFLTRAQQLQPGDWTIYSAMGVAYDQLGDQKNAQDAYEHALTLKPDEPSVLSNYALSRMLAKDPDTARKLAARAESAGGSGDPKIMRNIAMIRSLAPETPAPAPVAVAQQPAPAAHSQTAPQIAQTTPESRDNRVVMQRVPVDPQAGPVAVAKPAASTASINTASTATHAPRALQPQIDAPHTEVADTAIPTAPKPVTSQPLPPVVKAAEIKPVPEAAKPATNLVTVAAPPLRATLPVKTTEAAKPAPVTTARMTTPQPVKIDTATASVTLRLAPPLKSEVDQPAQPPKVLPPVKAAASKDNAPGLRVSTNAY